MPVPKPCPLCDVQVRSLIDHLRTPEGEGCPMTPFVVFPEDQPARADQEG